jgi:glycosyltransferase involved in cell wall biosynthesis
MDSSYSKEPKISLIVPIFNAEKYLRKCINSIFNQTFTEFEVLMIDDGSTDLSGRLCDELAINDSRFRVIHKKNGGVSSARQTGLDNARGEYVIHVDPDDWVEPNMLEDLYAHAVAKNADMVICDFFWESGKSSTICKQEPTKLDNETILIELFRHLHGSCWNKLVKTHLFRQYNITFNSSISFCEDLMLNIQLLKHPLTIGYVNKAYYHYVQNLNPNSLSRKYTLETYYRDLDLKELLLELTKSTVAEYECKVFIDSMLIQRAFFSGFFTSAQFKHNFYDLRHSIGATSRFTYILKAVLYLSCLGNYRSMYKLIQLIKKVRMS